MAPTISAMMALPGMPSVSSGMKLVCAPALLAASGAATPSMAPRPKRSGVRDDFLLERIGREGRQRRAAARQHAEDRAERGAAQDRRDAGADFGSRLGHRLLQLDRQQAAVLRPAERDGELGDAEQADRDRHEADAVAEAREIHRHARRAGIDVDADEPEQQADQHHGHGLFRRAMREHHRAGEAEHHQAEIFRAR